MLNTRREVLKGSAVVAGLLIQSLARPGLAYAYTQNAFDAKSTLELYKSLGMGIPVENKLIAVGAPEIAENGALVQVSANTSLPNLKRWLFVVDKNPVPLIAIFNLTESVGAGVTLRCKFAQTSDFFAVAQMGDGRVYYAKKEVKVTLGGCGG